MLIFGNVKNLGHKSVTTLKGLVFLSIFPNQTVSLLFRICTQERFFCDIYFVFIVIFFPECEPYNEWKDISHDHKLSDVKVIVWGLRELCQLNAWIYETHYCDPNGLGHISICIGLPKLILSQGDVHTVMPNEYHSLIK